MKTYKIYNQPAPEKEAPVKEPETMPKEPQQQPGKEKEHDPWKVPSPLVNPTPKANFVVLK